MLSLASKNSCVQFIFLMQPTGPKCRACFEIGCVPPVGRAWAETILVPARDAHSPGWRAPMSKMGSVRNLSQHGPAAGSEPWTPTFCKNAIGRLLGRRRAYAEIYAQGWFVEKGRGKNKSRARQRRRGIKPPALLSCFLVHIQAFCLLQ